MHIVGRSFNGRQARQKEGFSYHPMRGFLRKTPFAFELFSHRLIWFWWFMSYNYGSFLFLLTYYTFYPFAIAQPWDWNVEPGYLHLPPFCEKRDMFCKSYVYQVKGSMERREKKPLGQTYFYTLKRKVITYKDSFFFQEVSPPSSLSSFALPHVPWLQFPLLLLK